MEKIVYACHEGKLRSRDLTEFALQAGREARYYPGGRRRLLGLNVDEVRTEISGAETVLLVVEGSGAWREDAESAEQADRLLRSAGRKSRSGTFADLMAELIFQ